MLLSNDFGAGLHLMMFHSLATAELKARSCLKLSCSRVNVFVKIGTTVELKNDYVLGFIICEIYTVITYFFPEKNYRTGPFSK